ncbi:TPA: cation transporter [Candidatus Marinimicrobia bacterium]|nr:cation transporter [Candidatus Neomarinimicrobiota bacterium]
MLSPLLLLIPYPDDIIHLRAFLIPGLTLAGLGLFLWQTLKTHHDSTLTIREGGVIVLLSWLIVILFSAWPFVIASGLSFSRALFESVSGWTTTGLSVINVLEASPLILLWRSIMQLAGGAGLAIIMMSAIMGPTGISISAAEGRSDQLVPHIRQSARLVLIIYSCYAIAGTIAYKIVGLSIFDSLNHAFCAISTGGFSTQPNSIGSWNSIAVEAVTLPLMILGNLSFITAWFLWRGKFRNVIRNGETRLLLVLIPLAVITLFIFTTQYLYINMEKSIRVAIFESISAITTTGYSTVSYSNWNSYGLFLVIVLMIIGGGTFSTAGGIKQIRVYLLVKALYWEIKRNILPQNAVFEKAVWDGNRQVYINDTLIRQNAIFVFLYLITYLAGVFILCACGYTLSDSLFEFASAIGTVGLSVGVTSASMPGIALWAEIFAMFLGRLEFIVIIISVIIIGKDLKTLLLKKR